MWGWLARRYRQYKKIECRDRTMLMSTGSVAVNTLIGVGKLGLGIALFSPWFMITAGYYILLSCVRGQILWRFRHIRSIANPVEQFDKEFAVFRRSGLFVCLIGASYLLVCVRMYFWGDGGTYPYYILYGVAAVAFYKIGMAIYGMIMSRRLKNPLFTTMKIIAFVDATVSIVAVQCALLITKESVIAATHSSALLGAVCSIIFVSVGMLMLFCKKRDPELA